MRGGWTLVALCACSSPSSPSSEPSRTYEADVPGVALELGADDAEATEPIDPVITSSPYGDSGSDEPAGDPSGKSGGIEPPPSPPRSIKQRFLELESALPPPPVHATKSCVPIIADTVDCQFADFVASAAPLEQCLTTLLGDRTLATRSGDAVVLTQEGVRVVSESSESRNVAEISLEENRDAARLVAAAVVSSFVGVRLNAVQRGRLERSCQAVVRWISNPRGQSPMTCFVRAAAGMEDAGLTSKWSGCPCGNRGLQLGNVCLEGTASKRYFRELPIDARIPRMLESAIRKANEALDQNGWAIDSLGFTGCHFARLERGSAVRSLSQQPHPRLSARLVSKHSTATACDISRVWTKDGAFSVEMFDLLVGRAPGPLLADELWKKGEGTWFRVPFEMKPIPQIQRTLTVTIVLRNALVDAGFVVFTPLTNASHSDHFHIALPDHADAAELADPNTTAERREQLIADDLARASGRKPAP